MTKSTSLTLATAIAALAGLSAQAQGIIAYDNTTGFQGSQTSRGTVEIGDEINLTTGNGSSVTEFRFEYFFNGVNGGSGGNAQGIVRFYAKDFTGNLQPGGDLKPGTLLFESQPFSLQNGFNQAITDVPSVTVPGRFIWTVSFSNISGGENPGLLFYNGVDSTSTNGDLPGNSRDDHWERGGPLGSLDWSLINNDGIIDNFGARVIATPEPTTIALALGGAAVLGFAARRRKA